MALEIKGMKRTFKFRKGSENITLKDPDGSYSPDMVMSYYANIYPELTTATVHGPSISDDKAEYEFKTTIGVKG
ncbi:PRTRC system protein C [Prevotella sp. HUN102]|uniref:PRTRC system protein C n=1 Tax=Prevotella sp. HUN102 TaxID=1392486 RepID=UPI00048C6CD6|nr:PRTRC system protein C [Prevotella sp. HUN102]